MYSWIVFLHIAGVFGFLLAHGASVFVSFKLRGEREPERVRAFLDLSGASLLVMYGSLALLLVTGIVAGFMGHWWGKVWIWASLGLLVVMWGLMGWLGTMYYDRVRKAVGLHPTQGGRKNEPPPSEATPEALDALLTSWRPVLLAAIGVGGLLVILWLMMFKPF